MLQLHHVTLRLSDDEEVPPILDSLEASLPVQGHFVAVVGPSGCGKSTLLKVIAGLREPTGGQIFWEGRDLATEGDLLPHEIGYVPQFSIAYDALTVRESVEIASKLRLAGAAGEERQARIAEILEEVGLTEIGDRRVQVLSGGQKRRLALALEMVASPRLLLCDEVTSGLDPKAEDEIAHLLQRLSRKPARLVVSVTHSLRHLSLCDSVMVLSGGRVAFHGSPEHVFHYFGVEKSEELFAILGTRTPEKWHTSWQKHRETYYAQAGLDKESIAAAALAAARNPAPTPAAVESAEAAPAAPAPPPWEKKAESAAPAEEAAPEPAAPPHHAHGDRTDPGYTPGLISQWWILFCRRWLLFFRDRAQVGLHLALLFGFPLLVVIFAWDGLPTLKNQVSPTQGNAWEQAAQLAQDAAERAKTASLVSGLIMFQVILLALMGSNNSAREIAGERLIFEKEKFSGLDPLAYVLSKVGFLGVILALQSIWMAIFVNWIVHFPVPLSSQITVLLALNAAVTFVCLGISAILSTPEQASLASIYLVGFQLPLSGAVLALPAALSALTRPFIASYWGWSGYIQGLTDRFHAAVSAVTQTKLASAPLCLWVLVCHCLVGLYVALVGCRRARWE